MKLEILTSDHFLRLFSFEIDNRDWFEQWVPPRPEGYYQWSNFERSCAARLQEISLGKGLYYLLLDEQGIIGRFNIADISGGVGDVGYRVAESRAGKGCAKAGLGLMIQEARKSGLSHLVAEALVENAASSKVLLAHGFVASSQEPVTVNLNGLDLALAKYSKAL